MAALWSAQEVAVGETLAAARLEQLRAFSHAQAGLDAAVARLALAPAARAFDWRSAVAGPPAGSFAVRTQRHHTDVLPAGFSAGRFIAHHHAITSSGRGQAGGQSVQSQGLRAIEALPPAGAGGACPGPVAPPIRVRLAGQSATDAQVRPRAGGGLEIIAASGARLWSAAPGAGPDQTLFDQAARFAGSLTPVDLDGDGLHDRLYAGDLAGRLWRLDLQHGADPGHFALAQRLPMPAGAARLAPLQAPPDVVLSEDGAGAHWLDVIVGTANTGGHNWLWVLRDTLPSPTATPPPPFALALGSWMQWRRALTMEGRTQVPLAAGSVVPGACTGPLGVLALLQAGGLPSPPPAPAPLGPALPLDADIELRPQDAAGASRRTCEIAGIALPDCSAPVTRVDYWRREDAE